MRLRGCIRHAKPDWPLLARLQPRAAQQWREICVATKIDAKFAAYVILHPFALCIDNA